ncbi:TetR/AcrR family transcriptional regulator [Streptomyces chiangmaiensis]
MTRSRIVQAAAELFHVKGVNAVTLDDVRAASGTSKSQLYHHFADKDELVRAVIAFQTEAILTRDRQYLERMNSFRALQRWTDTIINLNAIQDGAYGCPLGTIASARAGTDSGARAMLEASFVEWVGVIAAGLRRMKENGSLQADADPDRLAVSLMAALQGGYLLAQTARDTTPMRIAIQMALDHINSYTLAPEKQL